MQAIGHAIFAHGFDPALTGALGAAATVAATALNITALAVNPLHAFIFCAATKELTNIIDYPTTWIYSKLKTTKKDVYEDELEESPFANRQILESLTLASRIAAIAGTLFATSFFAPEMAVPVLVGVALYTAASLAKAVLYSGGYRVKKAISPDNAESNAV